MADIFISYSSHDRPSALALVAALRDVGYDVWLDQHRINAAARWSKEIVQAIDTCKIFAVLLSDSSLESENVFKELSLAAERHKQILPINIERVKLNDDFAYHLAGLQRIGIEETDAIITTIKEIFSVEHATTDTIAASSSPRSHRLAVLPFDDLSPAKDNEWFADGMVDELINTLGALDTMKVPSRTDVMYYKKHHPKAQEIAKDLNVRYLVGGSVRKAGDKIRITASLTDALANQQLWTSNFDGTFDDVFVFQETVAKQIATALKLKLSPEETKKIEAKPTENVEAYELYLRGLEYHHLLTRTGYEQALELYERAVALDPSFVDAYLIIASASVAYHRECSRDPKWLARAERSVAIAEKISGTTGHTLWIRGEIAWQRQEFDTAESVLKKAIELDPKNQHVLNILGGIYYQLGKYKEAAKAFERAVTLTPTTVSYFNLLLSISELSDEARLVEVANTALPFFEKAFQRNSDSTTLQMMLAFTHLWGQHPDEALRQANLLAERNDLDGFVLFNLGGLYESLGDAAANISMIRRAIANGFRAVEAVRKCNFKEEQHQKELQEIIAMLEALIEQEHQTV